MYLYSIKITWIDIVQIMQDFFIVYLREILTGMCFLGVDCRWNKSVQKAMKPHSF